MDGEDGRMGCGSGRTSGFGGCARRIRWGGGGEGTCGAGDEGDSGTAGWKGRMGREMLIIGEERRVRRKSSRRVSVLRIVVATRF